MINLESRIDAMKKQVFALLAGTALLAFASSANAAGPMQLSDNQMDGVSAGSLALANAVSVTFGEVLSDTFSQTNVFASTVTPQMIAAQAFSQGVAAGGFLFQAASASHADSLAQR